MPNFSWILDESSFTQGARPDSAPYIKLSLAEISLRSRVPLEDVIPALRQWVRNFTVPTYAIAWDRPFAASSTVLIVHLRDVMHVPLAEASKRGEAAVHVLDEASVASL